MAIVMSMKWRGVTAEQYNAARRIVNWEGDVAPGGLFHVAWLDADGLRVVDSWESPERFQESTSRGLCPA